MTEIKDMIKNCTCGMYGLPRDGGNKEYRPNTAAADIKEPLRSLAARGDVVIIPAAAEVVDANLREDYQNMKASRDRLWKENQELKAAAETKEKP